MPGWSQGSPVPIAVQAPVHKSFGSDFIRTLRGVAEVLVSYRQGCPVGVGKNEHMDKSQKCGCAATSHKSQLPFLAVR